MPSRQLQRSGPSRLSRFSCKVLLLLSASLGFQSLIGVYGDKRKEDSAKVQTDTITLPQHGVDLPDVTFDRKHNRGGGLPAAGKRDGEPAFPDDARSQSGGVLQPGKGNAGEGEGLLSPMETAEMLLADGERRCSIVHGAATEEEGGARAGQCLPTIFFMGVSKCGENRSEVIKM